MDNLVNQRLHLIVDDSDDYEDDEDYIAAPETYETDRASCNQDFDFQPGAMMQYHRQQNHQYDLQGRFHGNLSSRYDRQVQPGYYNLHQLRAPSLHGEGQMYCCCFAPPGSMPRCCMDAASCNSNNFGEVSSPATAEDGALQVTELIAFRKAAQMTRTIGAMVIKRQAALINHQLLQLQQRQQVQEDYRDVSRADDCIHPQVDESRPCKRPRKDDTFDESDSRLDRENRDTENARASNYETCVKTTRSSQEATLNAAAIQASPSSHHNSSKHGLLQNTGANSNACTTSTTRNALTGCVNNSDMRCPDEAAMRIWYQVDRMKRMSMFLKNAQMAQSLLLEEMKDCYCSNIHEGGEETHDGENDSEQQSQVNCDNVSQNEV